MKCSGLLRHDEVPRPGQPPGSAFAPYGVAFGAGDVVGALLDRRSNTIRCAKHSQIAPRSTALR